MVQQVIPPLRAQYLEELLLRAIHEKWAREDAAAAQAQKEAPPVDAPKEDAAATGQTSSQKEHPHGQ